MPVHSYIFFDIESSFKSISKVALVKYKKEFVALLNKQKHLSFTAYSLIGLKPGMRFMIHLNAKEIDEVQDILQALLHTSLGMHLKIVYTLFGMTRASPYSPPHIVKKAEPKKPHEEAHRYLIVYPFTKTIAWHLLPFEERGKIMKGHVGVGFKFLASIKQLLLYAYGVDDHEFIVSYYTDSLPDFQTLVMELRGTEARRYTHNDLPIFTCIHKPLKEVIETI